MALLETRHLRLAIGARLLCADLSLAFNAGENWAILGPNGSGKTTLLHALAGVRDVTPGTVMLDGSEMARVPARARARRLGLLLQDYETGFPAAVLETVLSGRHPHLGPLQWEGAADYAAAHAALTAVGLGDLTARSLSTLSGGERRRVEIATLLAQDAPILLLDEPGNHLDLHHQTDVLALLAARTRQSGHLNLFVLHDINAAMRFCNHALLLFGDGEAVHGPLAEVVTLTTLERLYRCRLRELRDGMTRCFLPA
jgi:iron complex transport system ATP-binding protein